MGRYIFKCPDGQEVNVTPSQTDSRVRTIKKKRYVRPADVPIKGRPKLLVPTTRLDAMVPEYIKQIIDENSITLPRGNFISRLVLDFFLKENQCSYIQDGESYKLLRDGNIIAHSEEKEDKALAYFVEFIRNKK